MQTKFYYADHWELPLKDGHRFPISKYALLRRKLVLENIVKDSDLVPVDMVNEELLKLAHDPDYINGVKLQTLPLHEARKIGLPLTKNLWQRSRASVNGFLSATAMAKDVGFSASLSGGTHHAHRDAGEGFCVFNDFAIAAYHHLRLSPGLRILVIDLDVHQGNGNSSILGQEKDVYLFSMHGQTNYPYKKVDSHLDISLPKHCDDELYLKSLSDALTKISKLSFDIIFYQAGVDPLKEDRFGHLDLSFEGLMHRDRLVFEFAYSQQLPLAMALGGGYSDPIDLSVEAYANTYRMAKELYRF